MTSDSQSEQIVKADESIKNYTERMTDQERTNWLAEQWKVLCDHMDACADHIDALEVSVVLSELARSRNKAVDAFFDARKKFLEKNEALEKQESAQEAEFRGHDHLGLCEACGDPIWSEHNLQLYDDGDVKTHLGECATDEASDIDQLALRNEINKEFSLLAMIEGYRNKRMKRLIRQLKIYKIEDGATHWVWAFSEASATKAVESTMNYSYADEDEDMQLESIVALSPQEVADFRFRSDGEWTCVTFEIARSNGLSCYLACSEW